jgi:hypothetical protein
MYALLIDPPLPQKNNMSAGTLIGKNENSNRFESINFVTRLRKGEWMSELVET